MPATPAWTAGLEALLNRWITESSQAVESARRLDGTALQINVEGLIKVRAGISHNHLTLRIISDAVIHAPAAAGRTVPAAVISGSGYALLRLISGGARHGVSQTGIHIQGDAETADSYRKLFALARPDLEEEMSRLIGDLLARRLSRLAKTALSWMGKVRGTAGENIAEYLQEESRDLVNRTELDEFLRGVDALRESADRVAARLSHAEQRLKAAG